MPNINDYMAALASGDVFGPNGDVGVSIVKNPNIDFGSSGAPGSSNATPSGIGLTPMSSPFLDTGTGLPSAQSAAPQSSPASSPAAPVVANPGSMVQLAKDGGKTPVGQLFFSFGMRPVL